jgi:hypothetical protein
VYGEMAWSRRWADGNKTKMFGMVVYCARKMSEKVRKSDRAVDWANFTAIVANWKNYSSSSVGPISYSILEASIWLLDLLRTANDTIYELSVYKYNALDVLLGCQVAIEKRFDSKRLPRLRLNVSDRDRMRWLFFGDMGCSRGSP